MIPSLTLQKDISNINYFSETKGLVGGGRAYKTGEAGGRGGGVVLPLQKWGGEGGKKRLVRRPQSTFSLLCTICSLLCTNCSLLCTNCSLLCANCSLLHGNVTWQPIIKIIAKISFTFPQCSARYCVQARCHGDIATGLGLQIMPAPVGQGCSLRSTQDILAEKG